MRVDRQVDFRDGELVFARDDQFVDHFRSVGAHDMGPQNFAIGLVANDLDEAVRGVARPGAPVGTERELAHLVVEALLTALVFGKADAGYFRVAIGHAGDVVVTNGVRCVPGQAFRHHGAFTATLVRQHRRTGHVTDGIVAFDAGLQAGPVHLDKAVLVQLDAHRVQADRFCIDGASSGHQHHVDLDRMALSAGVHH